MEDTGRIVTEFPSSSTIIRPQPDSHGQVVKLSAIDQIAPRDYMSICLFFRQAPDADKDQILSTLRKAILKAVLDIPELACCVQKRADNSREEVELVFDSTKGVEIHHKDYTTSELCGLWKYGTFDQLEQQHFPLNKLPSLIVQANFIPGGLIIGSRLHVGFDFNHVAGDGKCNFMLWSAISAHFAAEDDESTSNHDSPVQLLGREGIVKGELNVTLEEFPNWKLANDTTQFLTPTVYQDDEVFEYATYFLPSDKLLLLKSRILSTMAPNTKMGTTEALCAFIWRHIVIARNVDHEKYPEARLAITVDARNRVRNPGVPSTYWGNFAEPNAVAQLPVARLKENSSLSASSGSSACTIYAEAARQIRGAIAAVDDKAVRRLVGLLNQMPKSTTLTWNADRYPGPDMLIVCLQDHKYNDLYFGRVLGYSAALRVTIGDTEGKPDGRCLVLPPRRVDDRGLEISLQYDKRTIKSLKDNAEFSEYFSQRN
ncbi:hypothetical protein EDB82DRAFT_421510 [Fusarium venenatum]|uniref:uncharacterized protein n=1 Tax=Fusarium venenatum TaxID=56646 RepID=UPI001E0A22F7|nr:hypothetical protein EDB82DRAFT_421510 [Fusarium venenatum]